MTNKVDVAVTVDFKEPITESLRTEIENMIKEQVYRRLVKLSLFKISRGQEKIPDFKLSTSRIENLAA